MGHDPTKLNIRSKFNFNDGLSSPSLYLNRLDRNLNGPTCNFNASNAQLTDFSGIHLIFLGPIILLCVCVCRDGDQEGGIKKLKECSYPYTNKGVDAIVFTLQNRCNKTIWPGIQASGGQPQLMEGGLELTPLQSRNLTAPKGWSGRFWGRSGCKFNVYGEGTCATGDCGVGLYCNGAGGEPPASVAEITLDSPVDFYDVSLLDGFNMPISIFPYDDSGICPTVGCDIDLNLHCPTNLIVRGDRGEIVACKSACTAFQTPEYCCSGQFQNPNRCKPTKYSQYFKRACPSTYTYAFDDPSNTVTCRDSDYLIIFC